jgi:CRP-like cAMP-binding protein
MKNPWVRRNAPPRNPMDFYSPWAPALTSPIGKFSPSPPLSGPLEEHIVRQRPSCGSRGSSRGSSRGGSGRLNLRSAGSDGGAPTSPASPRQRPGTWSPGRGGAGARASSISPSAPAGAAASRLGDDAMATATAGRLSTPIQPREPGSGQQIAPAMVTSDGVRGVTDEDSSGSIGLVDRDVSAELSVTASALRRSLELLQRRERQGYTCGERSDAVDTRALSRSLREAGVQVFRDLEPAAAQQLAGCLRLRRLSPRAAVEIGPQLGCIVLGPAVPMLWDEQGQPWGRLSPGEQFGAQASMDGGIGGGPPCGSWVHSAEQTCALACFTSAEYLAATAQLPAAFDAALQVEPAQRTPEDVLAILAMVEGQPFFDRQPLDLQRWELCKRLKRRSCPGGEAVCTRGQAADGLYVVLSGEFAVRGDGAGDDALLLESDDRATPLLGPGGTFGKRVLEHAEAPLSKSTITAEGEGASCMVLTRSEFAYAQDAVTAAIAAILAQAPLARRDSDLVLVEELLLRALTLLEPTQPGATDGHAPAYARKGSAPLWLRCAARYLRLATKGRRGQELALPRGTIVLALRGPGRYSCIVGGEVLRVAAELSKAGGQYGAEGSGMHNSMLDTAYTASWADEQRTLQEHEGPVALLLPADHCRAWRQAELQPCIDRVWGLSMPPPTGRMRYPVGTVSQDEFARLLLPAMRQMAPPRLYNAAVADACVAACWDEALDGLSEESPRTMSYALFAEVLYEFTAVWFEGGGWGRRVAPVTAVDKSSVVQARTSQSTGLESGWGQFLEYVLRSAEEWQRACKASRLDFSSENAGKNPSSCTLTHDCM